MEAIGSKRPKADPQNRYGRARPLGRSARCRTARTACGSRGRLQGSGTGSRRPEPRHQATTAFSLAAPLPLSDREPLGEPKATEEVWLDDGEAMGSGPTRPSVSPLGCQRVGCDRISLRRASLRRKIAPTDWESGKSLPCSSAGCAFPSPSPHPGGHILCPRCKATSTTSRTNGRKS